MPNLQNEKIPQSALKALQSLHRVMLLGQVVFAAIAFFLLYTGRFIPNLKDYDHLLQVIAIVLSFGGFFISSSLFKKKLARLKETSAGLNSKLITYRSAAIIQWALLKTPALFSSICFLMVGNYAFLALAVGLILLFAMTAPNKTKMMLQLRLGEDEVNQL